MNRVLLILLSLTFGLLTACQSSSEEKEQEDVNVQEIVNEEIPIEEVEDAMDKMSRELEAVNEEIKEEEQQEALKDSLQKANDKN